MWSSTSTYMGTGMLRYTYLGDKYVFRFSQGIVLGAYVSSAQSSRRSRVVFAMKLL